MKQADQARLGQRPPYKPRTFRTAPLTLPRPGHIQIVITDPVTGITRPASFKEALAASANRKDPQS